MKKLNFLMGLFLTSCLFVACHKKDLPTPKLTVTPSSVSVKVAENATVKIGGGTAPYSVTEADKTIATATVTKNEVKVTGVKEGQTTLTVSDKNKVKGTIIVKVIKKS